MRKYSIINVRTAISDLTGRAAGFTRNHRLSRGEARDLLVGGFLHSSLTVSAASMEKRGE